MPSAPTFSARSILPAIPMILGIAWIAAVANRGFGFSDESFYLWWFARPTFFEATIQPFVPPLRTLFVMAQESITAMRLAGLAILIASGFLLGRAIKRTLPETGKTAPVLIPTAMLATYAVWIPTPNYNWLANIAAALLLAGSLDWLAGRRSAFASSMLVGVAGALAFFAKPPFAIVAVIAAMAILIRTAQLAGPAAALTRAGVAAVTCLLVMVGLIASTVDVRWFVSSLALGIDLLDFGNSPSTMIAKTAGELLRPPLAAALGILVLLLALAARLVIRDVRVGQLLFSVAIVLSGMFALRAIIAGVQPLGPVGSLVFLAACGAMALLVHRQPVEQPLWMVAATLFLLPLLLSFGSTNPIYYQTSVYLWPWFALVGLICLNIFPNRGPVVAAASGLALLALIAWASWKPYGLATPLWHQRVPVDVPFARGEMLMDVESAQFAKALATAGRGLSIGRNTPIVDLSAGGPGTALFVGARPPVFPWLVAIYPTSAATTDRVWQRMKPTDREAAILIGPFHPNQAASEPARRFFADPDGYRLGATVMPPNDSMSPIEIWIPAPARRRTIL